MLSTTRKRRSTTSTSNTLVSSVPPQPVPMLCMRSTRRKKTANTAMSTRSRRKLERRWWPGPRDLCSMSIMKRRKQREKRKRNITTIFFEKLCLSYLYMMGEYFGDLYEHKVKRIYKSDYIISITIYKTFNNYVRFIPITILF
uniref:Uncharacterized protein n=1 Tax=Cucumis melo TaxID=3656 RepID=A0A9I9DW25_CUCME